MIHTVPRHDSDKVRALFQGPHLRLVIDAVVAGNSPGTIWVDNRTDLKTVLMCYHAHYYYLAGVADNTEFNQALIELDNQRIMPEAITLHLGYINVY